MLLFGIMGSELRTTGVTQTWGISPSQFLPTHGYAVTTLLIKNCLVIIHSSQPWVQQNLTLIKCTSKKKVFLALLAYP